MATKVLIYGAGVIGQVYGGRLAHAGHAVTLLARGSAAQALVERGVSVRREGEALRAHPEVVTAVPVGSTFDTAFVCVRRDQLADVLPALTELDARRVVFLLNQCLELAQVREQVGLDRTYFGFPGVAGQRTDDGTIEYLHVPQQKTTIERRRGQEQPIVDLLRTAGFPVDVSDSIDGWLKTHAVFITAMGAAILAAGDSAALAADRQKVADLVTAVGEGFRALARQGVPVTPRPLRLIFTVVPRFVAVGYWRAQLRGPIGTRALGPHVRATRDTEFAALRVDVRRLVGGHGPTPHLDRLLAALGPG